MLADSKGSGRVTWEGDSARNAAAEQGQHDPMGLHEEPAGCRASQGQASAWRGQGFRNSCGIVWIRVL